MNRRRVSLACALCAAAALIWSLAARILGPSDLWHQSQPKTVSYTTDMLVRGGESWILPLERCTLPATKPPLYNWLAAPAVTLAGHHCEPAHKFPSIAAFILCCLLIARLGRCLDRANGPQIGWLASMMFAANYTMFKLGYLARPDMLLTLWLLIAWACATAIAIDASKHQQARDEDRPQLPWPTHALATAPHSRPPLNWLIAAFWLSIAFASLTKGPPAIVGVIYAVIASRVFGGSCRAFARFRPLSGLALCSAVFGLWVYGVWRIDAEHLQQVLWKNEIFGRFIGTGPEGNQEGLLGWFRTLPALVVYFMVRLAPWSVFSVLAMRALWRMRPTAAPQPNAPDQGAAFHDHAWVRASALLVVLVIALFTLSTSKRADYIAVTFAPGSLLASWWLLRAPPAISRHVPWAAPALAALTLTAMTWLNQLDLVAPSPHFGDQIKHFVHDAAAQIQSDPLPLYFADSGNLHLQAMLGSSQTDRDLTALIRLMNDRKPLWVVAGPQAAEGDFLDQRMKGNKKTARIQARAQSNELPRTDDWPGQVTLWRVEWPPQRRARPRASPP